MVCSPVSAPSAVVKATEAVCVLCGGGLDVLFDLGKQPAANSLLSSADAPCELYPLRLAQCHHCRHVQLADHLPPDAMFGSYVYRTGVSATMRRHFAVLAERIASQVNPGAQVYDVGSNDGTLLNALTNCGLKAQGVDPSSVAAGVPNTHSAFFTRSLAVSFRKERGPADVVVVANCLAHTPNPGEIVEAASVLLGTGGWLIVELPYLPDTIKSLGYDQIYHEHYSYFSAQSLDKLFMAYGFAPQRAERYPVHGGSLRVWARRVAKADVNTSSSAWFEFLAREASMPIHWRSFGAQVSAHRARLAYQCHGKKLDGLCAPAKATVATNFTGVKPRRIYEQTPDKINKFLPQTDGRHIPIVSWQEIGKSDADLFIIHAWNMAQEVAEKLPCLKGRLLVPLPRVEIH